MENNEVDPVNIIDVNLAGFPIDNEVELASINDNCISWLMNNNKLSRSVWLVIIAEKCKKRNKVIIYH